MKPTFQASAVAHVVRAGRVVLTTMIVTMLPMALPAHAQTPEARCEKMLPAAKLQAAAGAGLNAVDARVDKSGELECAWMRRAPNTMASVSIQYYDKKFIAATNGKTADAFYEDLIAPIEAINKSRREAVAGVGKRAVLVPADPQRLIVIERDDGLVRVVMNNLSKVQAIAVAKAVAAP